MKLFECRGVPVRIHYTSIILNICIAAALFSSLNIVSAFYLLFLYFGLQTCVLLHEGAHVLAAAAYGMKAHSITLYPFGGIAKVGMDPLDEFSEFFIAIAGPALNLLIVGLLFPFALFEVPILYELALVNFVMAFFNMLPMYPMDGGRVFRALLSRKFGRSRATKIAIGTSLVLIISMGVISAFFMPELCVISVVLLVMLFLEIKRFRSNP